MGDGGVVLAEVVPARARDVAGVVGVVVDIVDGSMEEVSFVVDAIVGEEFLEPVIVPAPDVEAAEEEAAGPEAEALHGTIEPPGP